jgi:hypothetical protein
MVNILIIDLKYILLVSPPSPGRETGAFLFTLAIYK